MAGGHNAAFVPCRYCEARASRTFEGITTDTYRCVACGGTFAIAWGECGGEPTAPQWPRGVGTVAERGDVHADVHHAA